jgi:hypothetical protein
VRTKIVRVSQLVRNNMDVNMGDLIRLYHRAKSSRTLQQDLELKHHIELVGEKVRSALLT